MVAVNTPEQLSQQDPELMETDEDWLIDFRGVELRRGGRTLVGPIDWQVELDERWVIIGPNGADLLGPNGCRRRVPVRWCGFPHG